MESEDKYTPEYLETRQTVIDSFKQSGIQQQPEKIYVVVRNDDELSPGITRIDNTAVVSVPKDHTKEIINKPGFMLHEIGHFVHNDTIGKPESLGKGFGTGALFTIYKLNRNLGNSPRLKALVLATGSALFLGSMVFAAETQYAEIRADRFVTETDTEAARELPKALRELETMMTEQERNTPNKKPITYTQTYLSMFGQHPSIDNREVCIQMDLKRKRQEAGKEDANNASSSTLSI